MATNLWSLLSPFGVDYDDMMFREGEGVPDRLAGQGAPIDWRALGGQGGVSPEEAYAGGAYNSGNVAFSQAAPMGRMEQFANRLIGNDRYQELPDDARKRALNMAIMSLGQSLLQAASAPDYRRMAPALTGAIPGALGTFEKALAGEQAGLEHRQDREYQTERRGLEISGLKEAQQEHRQARAQKRAITEEMIASGQEKINRARAAIASLPDSQKKKKETLEYKLSDLSAMLDMVRRNVKSGLGAIDPTRVMDFERGIWDIVKEAGQGEMYMEEEVNKLNMAAETLTRQNGEPFEKNRQLLINEYMAIHKEGALRLENLVSQTEANRARTAESRSQTATAEAWSKKTPEEKAAAIKIFEANFNDWTINPMTGEAVRRNLVEGKADGGDPVALRQQQTDLRNNRHIMAAINTDPNTKIFGPQGDPIAAGLLNSANIFWDQGAAPEGNLTSGQIQRVQNLLLLSTPNAVTRVPGGPVQFAPQGLTAEQSVLLSRFKAKNPNHGMTDEEIIAGLKRKGIWK